MDGILGLLKVKVIRGTKLAVRDILSSDPYVVVRLDKQDSNLYLLLNKTRKSLRGQESCRVLGSDRPHTDVVGTAGS